MGLPPKLLSDCVFLSISSRIFVPDFCFYFYIGPIVMSVNSNVPNVKLAKHVRETVACPQRNSLALTAFA